MSSKWNIFAGLTSLEIFQRSTRNLDDRQKNPEHFEGRIIFMSMFNDIDGTKKKFFGPYFDFQGGT